MKDDNEIAEQQEEEAWAILDTSALIPTSANLPQIMKEVSAFLVSRGKLTSSSSSSSSSSSAAPKTLPAEQKTIILQALRELGMASSPTIQREVIKQAEVQRMEAGEKFNQAWRAWEAASPGPDWVTLFDGDSTNNDDDDDPYDDANIQAAQTELQIAEATLYLSNLAWEGGEALTSFLNWAEGEVEEIGDGQQKKKKEKKKRTEVKGDNIPKDTREAWTIVSW